MSQVITQPAAEPATSSRPEFSVEVVAAEPRILFVTKRFMLPSAEPATLIPEDEADARALRDALEHERTPYDQVRRDLGLK